MKIALVLFLLQAGMLSTYVSKKEAYESSTAKAHRIQNVPTAEQEKVIIYISKTYFDKFREKVGTPLYINSVFRSSALNHAVGGARNSDHLVIKDSQGDYYVAYDIDQDEKGRIPNREVFNAAIRDGGFYKLIWEFNESPVFPPMVLIEGEDVEKQILKSRQAVRNNPAWVHLSWSTNPKKNTGKYVYQAIKRGGKTIYIAL